MKRLKCLMCVLILCLSLLPVPAGAAEEVCFASVNDWLLPLSEETMPVWVGGSLYVPSDLFDMNTTGVNLGFYYGQSKDLSTATLYNLQQMLVFDLDKGNCYDLHSGEVYAHRAVVRSGRIFLPVNAVCSYFGLDHIYIYTEYGYLVRVKNGRENLTDPAFLDAASLVMDRHLRNYIQSKTPAQPGQPAQPGPSRPPVDEPQEEGEQLCLAFRCETGNGLKEILDRLDTGGYRVLFLLSEEVLLTQDDLVRRMVGSGHSVGLLAEGEDPQACRERINRGNRLLGHAARTTTSVIRVPDAHIRAMEQEGWICWEQTMDALPKPGETLEEYAQRITNGLSDRSGTVYLTLDDSLASGRVLDALIRRMKAEGYTIITPLETKL